MKHLILALSLVFVALLSFAGGAPQKINYQAVVRNSAGNVMGNQHVTLKINLRSDNLTGNIVYTETDTVITSPEGIFTIVIGGGNINAGFDSIKWFSSNYFMQVLMDVNGGSNFTDMGTTQMVSVPYALYANTAGSVDLAPTQYPTITGNDTISVENSGYIIITSGVTPSAAVVSLRAGRTVGQLLCLVGGTMGSFGVRFENIGLVNIGNSNGGTIDLKQGDTLLMMWNGMQWIKIANGNNQ